MENRHSGREQRKSARLPAAERVRADYGGRQFAVADLSATGALILTSDPLPVGTELELNLTLEGCTGPIELTVVVSRSEPAGMGVRFTQFHRQASARLEEVLSLLARSSDAGGTPGRQDP